MKEKQLNYFNVTKIASLLTLPKMHSYAMMPTAKKSTEVVWFCRHMTSGAMYPGVPEVSCAFSLRQMRAMPKSVILRYPKHIHQQYHLTYEDWQKSVINPLTVCFDDEVLRFDVAMDDVLGVEVLETLDQARHPEAYTQSTYTHSCQIAHLLTYASFLRRIACSGRCGSAGLHPTGSP